MNIQRKNHYVLIAVLTAITVPVLCIVLSVWFSRPQQTSQTRRSKSEVLAEGISAYKNNDAQRLDLYLAELNTIPNSEAERQLLRAMRFVKSEDIPAALELLFSAAKSESTKATSLALAGELLFLTRDFQSAEGVLKAAIEADASNPDPHRWLAAWYYDVGAMDDALYHLGEVAKLDTADARPWRMRGMILSDFERHSEAIEAYETALGLNLKPHVKQEIRIELATSLLAARQPTEALEHLKQVDADAFTLSLQADCELATGNLQAAATSIENALALQPDHPKALMLKASLAREQGQKEVAIETLEFAVSKHPHEFDIRFHLMSAYNANGDAAKAEIQQREMARLRDLRDKFTELHHQSMQDKTSADLRIELGETAEALGKTELAISWYEAALSLEPESVRAKTALQSLKGEEQPEQ